MKRKHFLLSIAKKSLNLKRISRELTMKMLDAEMRSLSPRNK